MSFIEEIRRLPPPWPQLLPGMAEIVRAVAQGAPALSPLEEARMRRRVECDACGFITYSKQSLAGHRRCQHGWKKPKK